MNIKEIALKHAREYLTFKLGGRKELDVEEIVCDDEIYAEIVNELAQQFEALVAEITKQNEPVAWAIYVTGDLCDVFQNKDFALLEFNRRNQLYPEPSREFRGLYTIPPTAEQIAKEKRDENQ